MNNARPDRPMWFDKPMSSLLTPGNPFHLVPGIHEEIDHEVELGVVIGMRGKNIRVQDSLKHVAGYFVGLDFTNRVIQQINKKSGGDWCLAKGSNSFAAVSDFAHSSAIQDVNNVEIELQVNGEKRQSANSNMMIFDVATMIADISIYQELREGDLIFTGTPEGVATVSRGDKLVGVLRNGGCTEEVARIDLDIV